MIIFFLFFLVLCDFLFLLFFFVKMNFSFEILCNVGILKLEFVLVGENGEDKRLCRIEGNRESVIILVWMW